MELGLELGIGLARVVVGIGLERVGVEVRVGKSQGWVLGLWDN